MPSTFLPIQELKVLERSLCEVIDKIDGACKELLSKPQNTSGSTTEHVVDALFECLMHHRPCKYLNQSDTHRKVHDAVENDKQGIGYALAVFLTTHHSLPKSVLRDDDRPVYLLGHRREWDKLKSLKQARSWLVLMLFIVFGAFLCFQQIELLKITCGETLKAIHERCTQLQEYLASGDAQSAMVRKLFVA